ncbi:MAG: flavoprotein, partial [Acidobacteriota bacterium]
MTRWVRTPRAAAVELGDDVLLVARDGTVRRLEGASGELARVVLAHLAEPRSGAEVIAHVEELAGPLGERRAVVDQLVALLAETGAIAREPEPRAPGAPANIVVAVSGAIAATHAPALVAALQQRGHAVEIALTATATRFVAIDALAAIARREPHVSLWPRAAHAPVPHVALAEWADLVVVYPASATTIGRIAHGDFSDLVAAIALATRAPTVIVPSMNAAMLAAPAVQRNLATLREDGHAIVLGVPSHEVADAPEARDRVHGAAPAPGELAATVEALHAAGVLRARPRARDWDAAY